jgi:hypothetical protein
MIVGKNERSDYDIKNESKQNRNTYISFTTSRKYFPELLASSLITTFEWKRKGEYEYCDVLGFDESKVCDGEFKT